MNILLVNDDGYNAPGIKIIKEILSEYGTIYNIAPLTTRSGAGAGITTFKQIKYQKIDDYNYIVDGTPVDCVQLSTKFFKEEMDLVVSGCNNGFNLSNDTMYSGTCGACYQALIFDKKAIAISTDKFDKTKPIPKHIKVMCAKAIKFIFENNLLSDKYYLNVNLPNKRYEEDKGIRITKLYRRHTYYTIDENESYDDIIRIRYHHNDINTNDIYDVSATDNGYISITPIRLINYSDEDYDDLVKKLNQ